MNEVPARTRRERRGRGDDEPSELRALVTRRGSQVSGLDALRARDWARPEAADLAAAEREVVVVRRHYVPPQPLETVTKGKPRERRGPAAPG